MSELVFVKDNNHLVIIDHMAEFNEEVSRLLFQDP